MWPFSRHKPLKAYWWTKVPNFGDALAPLLLQRWAEFSKVVLASAAEAEVVSVGSVLEHIPAGWSGYIVGSGRLREDAELKFDPSQAKILALRGPLSARGFSGSFALGDPGLLANELVDGQNDIRDIGILPHWMDKELVPRFRRMIPAKESVRIIHPGDDPLFVLKEIASCKKIVTSSLHGMIAADAFGIPRRFEYCKKMDKEGGVFKLKDYSASIQTRFETGKLLEPSRNRVEDAKSAIWDAYRELGRAYGNS
jgi:pyruvyltransferase